MSTTVTNTNTADLWASILAAMQGQAALTTNPPPVDPSFADELAALLKTDSLSATTQNKANSNATDLWAEILAAAQNSASLNSSNANTSAADAFAAEIAALTNTGAATASSSSTVQPLTVVTKIQPDGSVVVMVMQGSRIISERKISAATAQSANTQVQALKLDETAPAKDTTSNVKADEYNTTVAAVSGSLFNTVT
jgi:hypothetical protein